MGFPASRIVLFLFATNWCLLTLSDTARADMFSWSSISEDELQVKSLLLNQEDIGAVFISDKQPQASSSSFDRAINLAVYIRNISNMAVWGTLVCDVQGYGEVRIFVPHLVANMTAPVVFVVPLSGMLRPRKSEPTPTVTCRWGKLSSK